MIDVTVEAVINAEPEGVAAYAMDPANDPIWIGGISQAEPLTPGPLREGTRVRRIASFLGRKIEYVLEVSELEPGQKLRMRSVKSPFPMDVTYRFAKEPDGTRASIRVSGEPGRRYLVGNRLMSAAVRRNLRRDLARLKGQTER